MRFLKVLGGVLLVVIAVPVIALFCVGLVGGVIEGVEEVKEVPQGTSEDEGEPNVQKNGNYEEVSGEPSGTLDPPPSLPAPLLSTPDSVPPTTASPTGSHRDLDHISYGRLWPLTVEDFDEYCGPIRDEYWHLIHFHGYTTFLFINVATVQLDFPVGEIGRRLTMCGLDLNGTDCVGPACDWESPPKLGPDGRIIVPPKFKE